MSAYIWDIHESTVAQSGIKVQYVRDSRLHNSLEITRLSLSLRARRESDPRFRVSSGQRLTRILIETHLRNATRNLPLTSPSSTFSLPSLPLTVTVTDPAFTSIGALTGSLAEFGARLRDSSIMTGSARWESISPSDVAAPALHDLSVSAEGSKSCGVGHRICRGRLGRSPPSEASPPPSDERGTSYLG